MVSVRLLDMNFLINSVSVQIDQYLEKLERTHIVLFHEGGKETKQTEYGFIKKGLDKKEYVEYFFFINIAPHLIHFFL